MKDLSKSCLVIAGERSGEDHALSFLPEVLKSNPDLNLFGVGGNRLANLGMDLVYHLKDFSTWGVTDAVKKIFFYIKAFKRIEREVERRKCKVAILIDFQTFNLKLAQKLSAKGVKVLYFVAPQAWGWKAYRAKVLAECTSILFTIIPFEQEWFKLRGVNQTRAVPHPLWRENRLKILASKDYKIAAKPFSEVKKKTRILLLPGSRKFEVDFLLPEFVRALTLLQADQSVEVGIVKSPNLNDRVFWSLDPSLFDHKIQEFSQLDEAFKWAHLAIASSGTVTLQCALFNLPTIVCYNGGLVNRWIFETFIEYNGPISLANIFYQRGIDPEGDKVFPEFVLDQANYFEIYQILKKWTSSEEVYTDLKKKIEKVEEECENLEGSPGVLMGDFIRNCYE